MKKLLLPIFCWIATTTFALAMIEAPGLPLSTTQTPSAVNWRKITTDNFEVIFPEGLEASARETASSLEVLYVPVSEGLAVAPHKLSVVLQAHTLQSNGFVTLAPRRSEWFVVPFTGPDVAQTEWLKTLAVHEFRHVVQFDKSRTGFAKALRFILGDVGTAIAIGFTLPAWYLEGDAVGTETALSSSGRGRQPFFERDLRAIMLDNQKFTYEQMALGNYTRWRPNHYVLGYFLTTYLKTKYGRDIFEKIHRETMERAYNPLAFYNAIEKFTGKSMDTVFRQSLSQFKREWKKQYDALPASTGTALPVANEKRWVSYNFPVQQGEDTITYREGLDYIGQYVKLNKDGEEEVLFTPAPLLQEFPAKLRAGKLALSEVSLHPRWGMEDFSWVRVRDVKDGDVIYEQHGRGLLPTLDHTGRKLAIYEWSNTGDPKIQVVSVPEGQKLFELPWQRAQYMIGMDFIQGRDALAVLFHDGTYKLTLAVLDLKTGDRQILNSTEQWNWAYPVADGEYVYLQSPASGIDQIHRFSLRDGREEQVTTEKLGAYHPWLNNGELIYSAYTAQGLKPMRLRVPAQGLAVTPSTHVKSYEKIVAQEGKGDVVGTIKTQELPSEEYSRMENVWNPHSWMIIAPPFTPVVAAQLRSTDLLNTTDIAFGAQWNLNERAAQGFASLRWSYLYPLFDFRAAFGARREEIDLPGGDEEEDSWEEGTGEVGITVPWTSLHGAFVQSAAVRGFGQVLHAQGRVQPERGELASNTLAGAGIQGSWSFMRRQAARDLLPRWGVSVEGTALSSTDTQRSSDESFHRYSSAQVFVPGIMQHHHLYGELSQATQARNGYHFASAIFFPRGHEAKFLEQQQKASVNYAFPIAYPEWAPGRYFYLKRIALNAFYDNSWGRRYTEEVRFESRGAELWFDTHIVRNMFGFQWGIRYNAPVDRVDNWDIFLNTGVASW